MRGWPVVGQDAAVARVFEGATAGGGAAVVGPPGVGKTTLASMVADRVSARGAHEVWLRPTREMAKVPLGAMAGMLTPIDDAAVRVDLVARARAAIGGLGPLDRLLLVVDDAHLLDELTAAVLHLAVANDGVRAIITARTGERVPDAVTQLWKDGVVDRVELDPLDRGGVEAALVGFLGGPVEPSLVHDVWRRTGGNPLFVRELVTAGVDRGALEPLDGVWRAKSPLPPSTRLADLISARVFDLPDDTREALELCIVGEPLDLPVLEHLAGDGPITDLERRGLIAVDVSQEPPVTRPAHPMFGEVVAAQLPVSRVRAVKRTLAAAMKDRRGAEGRVFRWHLDVGTALTPAELIAGAEHAFRLADLDLADRAARAAYDAEPGVHAGVVLARVLIRQERHAEADHVLDQTEPLAVTDEEIAAVAQSRSQALSYGLGRFEDAASRLEDASARVNDQEARDLLVWNRAAVLLYQGHPLAAVETAAPVVARGSGNAYVFACLISAVGTLLAGRFNESRELGRRALATPAAERFDPVGEQRIVANSDLLARLELGDVDAAVADGEATYEEWSRSANPLYGHWLAYTLGRGELLRGRATAAAGWFQHARKGGAGFAPESLARWAAGNRAFALVLAGYVDGAAHALEDDVLRGAPVDDDGAVRATAWLHVARGETREASECLERAAEVLGERTSYGFEVSVRHDLVRLGVRSKRLADRFDELAELVDGPLMRWRATHAKALLAADHDLLTRTSEFFSASGLHLTAAEAMAQAAAAARDAGRARIADALARRATGLFGVCDAAPTPALAGLGPVADLTPRERAIAKLAAAGMPSKEIAGQLGISRRTVDNALQRVFDKLGISSRTDLAPHLN